MSYAAMLRLASAITDIPTPDLVSKLNKKWLACESKLEHDDLTH